MNILTYEEWCEQQMGEITWHGRRFHNMVILQNPDRIYLEDWITGERIIKTVDELRAEGEFPTLNIAPDLRYIPLGNRNYSDEMWPEYLAIGADKWDLKPYIDSKYCNRPPPLP